MNGKPGGLARARTCNMSALASKGGRSTHAKYGSEHMRAIGKRGAKVFWTRYSMKPVGTSGWAILRRADNSVVNFIGSLPRRRGA